MAQIIEVGSAPKDSDIITINFQSLFTEIPTVCISPYWENQSGSVPNVPTIIAITNESFTVSSANAAAGNYFVNWIAIGS
jgi:hypothetical protein